jgi:hypothetical protein
MQEVNVFDLIAWSVCPLNPSNVKDAWNKFTIGHFSFGYQAQPFSGHPPTMRSETNEPLRLLWLRATNPPGQLLPAPELFRCFKVSLLTHLEVFYVWSEISVRRITNGLMCFTLCFLSCHYAEGLSKPLVNWAPLRPCVVKYTSRGNPILRQ